jgi:phosphoribosylformylglycinamidine synthase
VGDVKYAEEASPKNASHSEAATLFNESQSRIVISVAPENLNKTISFLRERHLPFQQLGKVSAEELEIRVNEQSFCWRVADLYDDWFNAIRRAVGEEETIPSL